MRTWREAAMMAGAWPPVATRPIRILKTLPRRNPSSLSDFADRLLNQRAAPVGKNVGEE